MYDQAFKTGLWRQGLAAAIGMVGSLVMMVFVTWLIYIFRSRDWCWQWQPKLWQLMKKPPLTNTIRHIIVFFMLTILLPLAWVLLLSVKSMPDSMRGNLWPRKFDFNHYAYVFEKIETVPQNLFNSIYITSATVLITSVCAILAGYAIVHLKPKGSLFIVTVLVLSLYFPTRVVSIISIYEIQDYLSLINSRNGLILPYITLNLAVSVLIMRSIFQLIPGELIDSARMDGAGPWRTLLLIGIPLAKNGLVVIIIVNFVTAWGEYLLAATLTNDQEVRTMPVVLASVQGGMGQWAWPRIAAVYVIVVLPGIIAFAMAQKLFFKGLMEGALKTWTNLEGFCMMMSPIRIGVLGAVTLGRFMRWPSTASVKHNCVQLLTPQPLHLPSCQPLLLKSPFLTWNSDSQHRCGSLDRCIFNHFARLSCPADSANRCLCVTRKTYRSEPCWSRTYKPWMIHNLEVDAGTSCFSIVSSGTSLPVPAAQWLWLCFLLSNAAHLPSSSLCWRKSLLPDNDPWLVLCTILSWWGRSHTTAGSKAP